METVIQLTLFYKKFDVVVLADVYEKFPKKSCQFFLNISAI